MLRGTILHRAVPLGVLAVLLVAAPLITGCHRLLSATSPALPTPAPRAAPAVTPAPASSATRLVVADFDNCTGTNNLDGSMGAAYNPPDSLKESYVEEANRGCVARLEYKIRGWSAFWMKLQGADLSPYSRLIIDVRGDPASGIPKQMKLELKRGGQVSISYISGIGAEWQTIGVKLADFGFAGYGAPVSSWAGMEELVFTLEAAQSGGQGLVYLDNVVLVP